LVKAAPDGACLCLGVPVDGVPEFPPAHQQVAEHLPAGRILEFNCDVQAIAELLAQLADLRAILPQTCDHIGASGAVLCEKGKERPLLFELVGRENRGKKLVGFSEMIEDLYMLVLFLLQQSVERSAQVSYLGQHQNSILFDGAENLSEFLCGRHGSSSPFLPLGSAKILIARDQRAHGTSS
jgi:hypothetical protein